ncbi:hypothetical protein PG994_013328 [Apiospora phragmitis]|uniref:Uncharacterized protein n=1 Tax=Apiospora phragmitis TaxID=2905665 RepID=A0ABR1TA37_9PEZI
MAEGTESDIIDTPPPSYEDVCPGPVKADIGAVTDAQLMPQDPTSLKTVDGVMHRVDDELRRFEYGADVDYVSSGIRQLCRFAACRVSENHRGQSNVMVEERRQTNHSEIDKLIFSLVMKPIAPKSLINVLNMTANAFEEVAEQVLAERKYSNHWQARGEYHIMRSSIYRAAVRACKNLAENKTFPPSTLAALASAASCYDGAANSCVQVAEFCTY